MGSNFHEMPVLTLEDLLSNSEFENQIQNQNQSNQNMNQTNDNNSSFSNSSFSNSNSPSNSNSNSTNSNSNSNSSNNPDGAEDSVIFSDFVFSYIDRMLMEEEKFEVPYQTEDMLATERQLSAILDGPNTNNNNNVLYETGQLTSVNNNFPLWPPDYNDGLNNNSNNTPYEITSNDHSLFYGENENNNNGYYNSYGNNNNGYGINNGYDYNDDLNGINPFDVLDLSQIENSNQLLFADTNSLSPSTTITTITNSSRSEKQTISTPNSNDSSIVNDNNKNSSPKMGLEESMFRKGIEEAQKFLPKSSNLIIDLDSYSSSSGNREIKVKEEIKKEEIITDQRGTKNRYNEEIDDLEYEGGKRNNKQFAFMEEESIRAMFDKVLLGGPERCMQDMMELRISKEEEIRKESLSKPVTSNPGRGRGRRKSTKEVVDLRTILIHCAQAVATDDRRSAGELLRQIRQHASPTGDATQRLAQCFADGLAARLGGTGSNLYQSLIAKRTSATELLKAYQLYMAACPFKKISFYFSNQTILDIAEGKERLHIIDLGIHYGFQWPCLLQRLAGRTGGPPAVKITGIDNPQPGFRPAERIQETGRRLTDYAKMFNVPFEFHTIAAKWDDVKVSDINLDPNEITIVNCLFQLKNLPDETVTTDSPRDKVLQTIKDMKPDVFIHGIVNGSYNAPFFVTRFREALFHYSAMFDMLEANVPRENEHRLLIERDLFGRSALNVIACEGLERVERPETYKQWQIRDLRAGFKQLGLNEAILKMSRDKVKKCYHKDFVVDVDNGWLLQGWKGRIVYGMSTWKVNQ